jgi:hypothetical protein
MRIETIVDEILKRWGERELRKKILSYKKKLNGRDEKQPPSDTKK